MAPSPSRKCVRVHGKLEVCIGDLVEVALSNGKSFYGRVEDLDEEVIVVRSYSIGSGYGTASGVYLVIVKNVAYIRLIK